MKEFLKKYGHVKIDFNSNRDYTDMGKMIKYSKELEQRLDQLTRDNKLLKESKSYICAGASGRQSVNECCGGCSECIEMQMCYYIEELTKENERLKRDNKFFKEGHDILCLFDIRGSKHLQPETHDKAITSYIEESKARTRERIKIDKE